MTTTTTTTDTTDTWTYEGYWNCVLGTDDAEAVVRDFDLKPDPRGSSADRLGLDEWLGQSEADALGAAGLGELPESWGEHHEKALTELVDAVTVSAIQVELDRLTDGHVAASRAWDRHGLSAVEIADEQGGAIYDPDQALAALRGLTSEGDDDRDLLWTALETVEASR